MNKNQISVSYGIEVTELVQGYNKPNQTNKKQKGEKQQ